MRASRTGDNAITQYMNADYYVDADKWLFISSNDDEIARFSPGEWTGVERF